MLDREGPVEVNLDHTDFFTLFYKVFGGLFSSVGARAHKDYYALCVFSAYIVEELVRAASKFGKLFHRLFDNSRSRLI